MTCSRNSKIQKEGQSNLKSPDGIDMKDGAGGGSIEKNGERGRPVGIQDESNMRKKIWKSIFQADLDY